MTALLRIVPILVGALALGVVGCADESPPTKSSGSVAVKSGSKGSGSGELPPKRGTGVLGTREKVKVQEYLRNLSIAYMTAVTTGKPPHNEDDIKDAIQLEMYDWIKEGYIKVYWNVDPDKLAKPSETILAYENTNIEGGRFVLMAGGAVMRMSKKEFEAAPKAGKN